MDTGHDARQRAALLDDFAMDHETAVTWLPAGDYLKAFCDLYRIRRRDFRLVPSAQGFYERLREMCGDRRGIAVAEMAERLFGMPGRVADFEDAGPAIDQLETSGGGLGPFYCVFDVMFCEYEGFALCFISGTNN